MKALVLFSFLIFLASEMAAQEVTQLEEAQIDLAPIELVENGNADEYQYVINDGFAGEFIDDPLAFVNKHFDINHFISSLRNKNYSSFLVRFSTNQGSLEADYSGDGKLNRSIQKFKDVVLPLAIRNELFRQTKGWNMVKNTYTAIGNGDLLEKEKYRIKVKNGNKSKIVKIDPKKLKESKVASQ